MSQAETPNLMQGVSRLIIMGGDLSTSHLDLNFKTDPGAVHAVLRAAEAAGVEIELVPVQLCIQAAFSTADVSRIEEECGCSKTRISESHDRGTEPHHARQERATLLSAWRRRARETEGNDSEGAKAACLLTGGMRRQAVAMPIVVNPSLSEFKGFGPASRVLSEGFVPWDLVALHR